MVKDKAGTTVVNKHSVPKGLPAPSVEIVLARDDPVFCNTALFSS